MHVSANNIVFPSRVVPLLLAILTLAIIYHTNGIWDDIQQFNLIQSTMGDVSSEYEGNNTDFSLRLQGYIYRVVSEHGLTKQAEWMSWHVQPTPRPKQQAPLIQIPTEFQPQNRMESIDVRTEQQQITANTGGLLRLPVSSNLTAPGETDASQFLFAMSTSYERLMMNDMAIIRGWQRYMTKVKTPKSNGANLLILLDRATMDEVAEIDDLVHQAGLEALIYTTEDRLSLATRYLALVEELRTFGGVLAATGQYKQWFALIDDTIFFPSMSYLSERLSAYNTDDELYVGLPSDERDWVQVQDTMTTYGGGAVFLTRKAISQILSAPCADLEIASEPPFKAKKWDVLVQSCLTTHAQLDMHVLPAMYMPPKGNPSSTITSTQHVEAPPLVIHTDDHNINFLKAHIVTDVCGERCFLQKFAFADDWVLENGVEISRYLEPIQFENGHQRGDFSTPRLANQIILDRSGLKRRNAQLGGERQTWKLLDATRDTDGTVWQAYVRKAPRLEKKRSTESSATEVDSIIVLTWEN